MQEIIIEKWPEDGVQNDLRVHWPQQQGAQEALHRHQPLLRMKHVKITLVMRIRDVYPRSRIRIFPSGISTASKNSSILNHKIDFKLSKKLS